MSRIACPCGGLMRDTTVPNTEKAQFIKDVDLDASRVAASRRCAAYLEAVVAGAPAEWMRAQGFTEDYLNLNLSQAQIIDDLIAGAVRRFSGDILECTTCGRLAVEAGCNRFVFYRPDAGEPVGPFVEPMGGHEGGD